MSHIEFPKTMSPCVRMFIESLLDAANESSSATPSTEVFPGRPGIVTVLSLRDTKAPSNGGVALAILS